MVAVPALSPEYVLNNFNFQFVTFHRFSKKKGGTDFSSIILPLVVVGFIVVLFIVVLFVVVLFVVVLFVVVMLSWELLNIVVDYLPVLRFVKLRLPLIFHYR